MREYFKAITAKIPLRIIGPIKVIRYENIDKD
jgi:hypothetical protein